MKKLFHYGGNIAEAFIAFVLYGVLQMLYFTPKAVEKRFRLPMQGFFTALITVIVMAFIFWMYEKQLQEFNDWDFNEEPHWRLGKLFVSVIGFFLITILGATVLQIVGSNGQTISSNQQQLDMIAKQSGNLFKIMVVFIAPFCEEVIFRGMFFNTFFTKKNTTNKWIGILVCGFLFAYVHDPHITKFILVYWVLGCVLSWVYLTTKDLRYSMLTHMAYNFLGFI